MTTRKALESISHGHTSIVDGCIVARWGDKFYSAGDSANVMTNTPRSLFAMIEFIDEYNRTNGFERTPMSTTTNNEAWGYYGTIVANGGSMELARAKFAEMVETLADRFNVPNTVARDYLDSKYGRHLADCVCDFDGNPTKPLPQWIDRSFRRWEIQ